MGSSWRGVSAKGWPLTTPRKGPRLLNFLSHRRCHCTPREDGWKKDTMIVATFRCSSHRGHSGVSAECGPPQLTHKGRVCLQLSPGWVRPHLMQLHGQLQLSLTWPNRPHCRHCGGRGLSGRTGKRTKKSDPCSSGTGPAKRSVTVRPSLAAESTRTADWIPGSRLSTAGSPLTPCRNPVLVRWSVGSFGVTEIPFSSLNAQELLQALSRGGVSSHARSKRNVAFLIYANCGYAGPCRERLCENQAWGSTESTSRGPTARKKTCPQWQGRPGGAAVASRSLARRRAPLVVTTWKPSVSGRLPRFTAVPPCGVHCSGGLAERLGRLAAVPSDVVTGVASWSASSYPAFCGW
ncbi:hypothetical protein MRX96_042181 [Rhipicephalus microplus]